MPKKRMVRRRGRKRLRRGKRKFYKSKVGKGEVMVNRTPARLHTLIAPHYLTKLDYGYSGNINQAIMSGNAAYWSIYANGLHFPGNTSNPFTAAAGFGVLYPATLLLAALNPIGHSQLGVLYSQYRVYASKIQITVSPVVANANTAFLCVYPASSDMPVTDFQRAMMQPYSKDYMISAYNNEKQNTIQTYIDNPTILGLTKQQYNDLGATAALINANPVGAGPTFWNIIVQPASAGNNNLLLSAVNIKVTYWVEYFDPLPPTDV